MTRSLVFAVALLAIPASLPAATTYGTTSKTAIHHKQTTMRPKVSEADARVTALAQVPGAQVKAHELEREHGKLIYSYDLEVPGKTGVDEVQIDAMTGKLVSVKHETPKAEQKEKVQEQKEAKKASGTGH